MPSRMNKYYEEEDSTRSRRNEKLYKSLYETTDYSNISSIATLEKTNEIDIAQVKQLIKDRENYQKQKEYYNLIKKNDNIIPKEETFEEEKNYDIKETLSKAKEERKTDEKEEFLKNKHYDYLLNSQLYNKKREIELNEKEEKLKEIINTITNTLDLNKLSNKDLSLNLLDDLKGNTNEITSTSVRRIIEGEKQREEKINKDSNIEMDKSFYTSAMNFSDKDFDDEMIQTKEKGKGNLLIKIMLIVMLLIIIAITIYVIIKNI